MLNSTRQKCFFCPIIYIILITFLWSNLVWAYPGLDTDKLQPSSNVAALAPVLDAFATGQEAIRRLTDIGISSKDAFYKGLEDELKRGKIGSLSGIPCLVFSDPDDSSKLAYYVFNPKESYFSRITTHPEVNDSLWNFLKLTDIDKRVFPDVREFEEKGREYYQYIFVMTDSELGFINACLKMIFQEWQVKNTDINSFAAKISRCEQGIEVEFNSMDKYPISTTPIWNMAGWEMRFVQLAPGVKLEIDKSSGGNYVKVITGELTNINRGVFTYANGKRDTLVAEDYIQAGDTGAIVAIMVKTDNAPTEIKDMDQSKITGPMAELLNWRACEEYKWGAPFKGMPFYNIRGFRIKNGEGKDVCYVQFWSAGKGVNCGMHDHSETDANTTFCEIHLGLFNGTGDGGMVSLDADGDEVFLPIKEGEEHGPFWDIDLDTGRSLRRENGAVSYGMHRWQAGGKRVEREEDESFDIWAVFEIPPDEAIIKNIKSAGLLGNTPWGAKLLYPNISDTWEYGGREFSVQPRWVPESTKGMRQVIGEDELMRLVLSPGWKVVITRNYDEMTYAALYIIVNLMEKAEAEFCFGLATGGTTESLRKAMGLIDLSRQILNGLSVPVDKIKMWETLDNYYWPVGSDPRIVAIASYYQEQNYMLLENLYGEKLRLDRFVAPPDVTGMTLEETALDFYRRMRIFMDDAYRVLVQMHGIGSSGHDAFNEVFMRLKRSEQRLITDLRKYVDIPEFEEVPSFYYEMGLMRPDHGTVCLDITRVQNIGHIVERSFHPFFLRFMADNLLYSIPELLVRLSSMSIEEIATYYPEPKYRFISEQDFIMELQYLLDNYKLTPRLAITQGTGDIALMTAHPDSVNLVMACSPHKQEPFRRAVDLKPSAFCTASWLQLAANAIVIATEDSAGAIDWSKCFLFEPRNKASSLCTEAKIEGEWEKTEPGERIQTLIKGREDVGLTKDSHEIPEYNFAISKIKELMAKKQFREEEIDRFLDELIGLLPNLGVLAELLEIAFEYLFMVDGAKDEVYYYHRSLIEGLPELLKIHSTPKDRARILKGKISDLKEELSKEGRDKDAIITRNIFSWLARANEKVAGVKIPADSFGEYSIEIMPNVSREIKSFSIEPFMPEDEGLMEEWYEYARKNRMGFNVPKFYEWKDAISGRIKGFKLVTIDVQGKKRIEGWVTYEEVIGEGLFESYRENAPWNGTHVKQREIKGVATAIIKRVIEESVLRGYNGRLISIPSTKEGEIFAKRVGKKPTYTPRTQYGRVNWAYWTLTTKSALEFLEGYSKKCAQLGRRVMTVKRDNILHYADIARRTHETLPEELTRDLSCSFRMVDFTRVSLKKILERYNFEDAVLFESENISVRYNKNLNRIFIRVIGDDKRKVEGGIDRFDIFIDLTDSYTIKHIEWEQSYYMLSCSELSLILEKTDFKQKFPILFEVIKKQFVLPNPNEEIATQERIAGGAIVLSEYEERASKGLVDKDFISNVALLRYSKSWEIRQKGLKILRYLRDKGAITEEEMARFEGLFFAEDIKEDLRYLERFLRSDEEYIRQTFKNLFNRDITLSEIYNSEVTIRFLGRGFNKQIYKVEWRLGPDEVYVFAISTIRDAQLGQGDFSADAINTALGHWERLSRDRNPYVPILGAARWLKDYQPKSIRLERYETGVANDICVVSREFVEGNNLQQVLEDKDINDEEKEKARRCGLRDLLGIWQVSKDKDGRGIFMSTPKSDDVVVYRDSDGEWKAKVVDLDALEDGVTADRILEIFRLYSWVSIGDVKDILRPQDDPLTPPSLRWGEGKDGPKIVSIGGGNGPRRLAIGMAGYTKNVTNVITVFDNGGSTGIFRDCLDMPAVGDIRNRICALLHQVEAGAVLESIFDYRLPSDKEQDELIEELKEIFSKKEEETGVAIPKNIREELKRIISYYIDNYSDKVPLRGMSVGNIILAGEYFRCDKNLAKAVSNILKILGLDRIMDMIPVTSANLDIAARVGNNIVYGEHQIAHRENPELRIWGMFFTERGKREKVPPPEANPVVLKKIEEADAVVIGPGSLHTSCIPNLMVKGVPEAIRKSRGAKILVVNLLEYNEREGIWETRYYRASQIVEEVLRVLGGIGGLYTDYVQYVLVNNHGDKKGYIPVDLSELNKIGLEVIVKDLEDKDSPGYHDPKKLSQAIMEIIEKHRNPTSEDLVKELRRLHSDTIPVGVNAYYNMEDLYNKALEIYMKIIETCNDPVILLEAWRVLTTYQRYVIDHFDGYGAARTQELRGPSVLELQQRMLDKIRAVRDFSSSEVAAEIDNNVRFFGYLEPEKLVFFNILLNPNGNAQFKAIPSKVMTYSVTIPPEGPHADVGYVGITTIETKLESGGFIRGTIEGYAYDEKGFVRLDPPIGDFDIEAFLKKKLGKDQLSPEDYTKYEQILLDEIIEVVKFLSNGINLNKRLILYDSVRRMFRRYGIVIPGEVGLGRFIKLISGINEGIAGEASKTEEVAGLDDMLKDDVVIKNPLGLHARVAARIVRFVSEFKGLKIFIKKGGKIADAGSLSELIEIAGEAGDKVQILVGRDAERRQEAVDGIKRILDKEAVSIPEIKAVPEDISEDALVVRGSVKGLMHPGLIGNKGFGLLELAEQSPVPEAMFVTGVAYDLFVKESGLNPLIKQFEQLYERYNAEENIKEKRQIFTDINRKAREIREAVISREMPSKIKDMIKTEYRKLCSEMGVKNLAVAVRSSSTLEDILGASFAGIYESFLCVSGEEEIIKAVKNVWASLFSERAVKYIANLIEERRDTLPYSRIRQAVVIQRMIDPAVSGVAYTVMESQGESVFYIEVSYGVGEQIVNGKVTPDRWLVKKKEGSFEIVKQHMGKVNQERLCLTQEQIINLARDMDKIAGYYRDKYGYNNMNVEFAFDKNEKPYFLQARPLEGINLCLEEQSEVGDFIHGIGVCRGTAEGRIVYAKGIEDLPKEGSGSYILLCDYADSSALKILFEALDRRGVVGVITLTGGKTSHFSALVREIGIPCVSGIGSIGDLKQGELVRINGQNGTIEILSIERFYELVKNLGDVLFLNLDEYFEKEGIDSPREKIRYLLKQQMEIGFVRGMELGSVEYIDFSYRIGDKIIPMRVQFNPRRVDRFRDAKIVFAELAWKERLLAEAGGEAEGLFRKLSEVEIDQGKLQKMEQMVEEIKTISSRMKEIIAAKAERQKGKRQCNLCREWQVEVEKGFSFRNFIVYPNPFPYVDGLVTIAYKDHIPQTAFDLESMMGFAKTAGYKVLFNSQNAGPTVPEHTHFQAFPSSKILPAEMVGRERLKEDDGIEIFELDKDYPVKMLVVEGKNKHKVNRNVRNIIRYLEKSGFGYNLLIKEENGRYQVYIVPRLAEQPSEYFSKFATFEMFGELVSVYKKEELFRKLGEEEFKKVIIEALQKATISSGDYERLCSFVKGGEIYTHKLVKEEDVLVIDPLGIHAKSAIDIVNIADRYRNTELYIESDGKRADGRSRKDLLRLGIGRGERVRIVAKGPDAERLLEDLKGLRNLFRFKDDTGEFTMPDSEGEDSEEILLLGGKGANLDRLAGIDGMNIPEWFSINSEDYENFIRQNNIRLLVDELNEKIIRGEDVSGQLEEIRHAISVADMPVYLKEKITQGYMEMAGKSGKDKIEVAVRSSAISEGTEAVSSAGIYDTVFAYDEDSLLIAVKKCWASLYKEEAYHYRRQRKINEMGLKMGVIVQRKIVPEYYGTITNLFIEGEEYYLVELVWHKISKKGVVGGEENPQCFLISAKGGIRPEFYHSWHEHTIKMFFNESYYQDIARIRNKFKFKGIQIEFAIDKKGKRYTLQVRPSKPANFDSIINFDRPICSLRDLRMLPVSPGEARGRVVYVTRQKDLPRADDVPYILLTDFANDTATSLLLEALDRGNVLGVITMVGGYSSHFATVVREAGIPYVSLCTSREWSREIEEGVKRILRYDEVYFNASQGIIRYVYAEDRADETFKETRDFLYSHWFMEKDLAGVNTVEGLVDRAIEMCRGYESNREKFAGMWTKVIVEVMYYISFLTNNERQLKEIMMICLEEVKEEKYCNRELAFYTICRIIDLNQDKFPGLLDTSFVELICDTYIKVAGSRWDYGDGVIIPGGYSDRLYEAIPFAIRNAPLFIWKRIFAFARKYPGTIDTGKIGEIKRRCFTQMLNDVMKISEDDTVLFNIVIEEDDIVDFDIIPGKFKVYLVHDQGIGEGRQELDYNSIKHLKGLRGTFCKGEGGFVRLDFDEDRDGEDVIKDIFTVVRVLVKDFDEDMEVVLSERVKGLFVRYNFSLPPRITLGYLHNMVEQSLIRPSQGPIGKIVQGEVSYDKLWEAEVRDAKVGDWKQLKDADKRADITPEQFNEPLNNVLSELIKVYGLGIIALVDGIRLVDNIDADRLVRGGEGIVPYAMMVKENGRNILLLDIDAFSDEELLYIDLEHEFKESIMTIVPCESDAVRELTTNYMSLKLALEKGIRINRERLKELGADLQFFEALEVLQAMIEAGEEITDEKIIAVAIEHMRAMPYYAELFKQFGFAGEWQERVKDAENRYQAAIQVFNDIMNARLGKDETEKREIQKGLKRVVEEVDINIKVLKTFTGEKRVLGLEGLSRFSQRIIGAMAKVIWGRESLKERLEEYVSRPGINLAKQYWIIMSKERKAQLEKMIGKEVMEEQIRILEGMEVDGRKLFRVVGSVSEVTDTDAFSRESPCVIYSYDLEDWDKLDKREDMLYLPIMYTSGSLYLAAQLVLAGGNVNAIGDKLILEIFRSLCGAMLGREPTLDDYNMVFRAPWRVVRITENINIIRMAIAEIEKAA